MSKQRLYSITLLSIAMILMLVSIAEVESTMCIYSKLWQQQCLCNQYSHR